MLLFERDIAVDLGTSSVIMYVRGKGISLREPTVVAVDKNSRRIMKIGEDAQRMLGRTPADIVAEHPISAGVISDYDMAAMMLKEMLSKITSFSLFRPRVLVCVPSCITGVEERAVIDAFIEAGARKVYLLESSVAAAIGAGADMKSEAGYMVVDIGGGTTDVAVVSMGGVAECESIKVAGDAFDEAIIRYVRNKHKVLIGLKTAEDLKLSIGQVFPRKEVVSEEVKGRCLVTGLPKVVTVTSNDMLEAVKEPTTRILEAIHVVLERTPPELVGDISDNGIILTGGGSLICGMDMLISKSTGITASVVDDALTCAVYGAGKKLQDLGNMTEGMINLARRHFVG